VRECKVLWIAGYCGPETGGSVDEVIEEAHLDEGHILAALERFAAEWADRQRRLKELLDEGDPASSPR